MQPWFLRHTRNRLASVNLNGSEPLKWHIPHLPRSETHQESGQLQWEWTLIPDYDHSNMPWRAYIPLRDDWVREGTQAWVFRLNPDKLCDPSTASPFLQIHPSLKADVNLIFRATQFICNVVMRVYNLSTPTHLTNGLRQADWVDGEYTQIASLSSKLWDVRRSILECYGWVSYHLLRDPQPWRNREWDGGFVDLMDNVLRFLCAPKRGCIINPASISTEEVASLVRHDVPIHYQWKPRVYSLLVDAWPTPSPAAARFDPYEFPRVYEYGAYKAAGGPFNNSAMDRAILGRGDYLDLSQQYLRHPPKRDLPEPANPGPGGKKAKLRFFAREQVGGVLTEITKKVMTDLLDSEAGVSATKIHPWGDMKLLTLNPTPLLHATSTNLAEFFDALDKPKPVTPNLEAITPPMASTVSDVAIMQEERDINASVVTFSSSDVITPSLVPAMPDVAIMQEDHDTSVSINTCSPQDVTTPSLAPVLQEHSALVSDSSATVLAGAVVLVPGQQAHFVEKKVNYQYDTDEDDTISLGDESEKMVTDSFTGESKLPLAFTTELIGLQLHPQKLQTLTSSYLNVASVR